MPLVNQQTRYPSLLSRGIQAWKMPDSAVTYSNQLVVDQKFLVSSGLLISLEVDSPFACGLNL